MWCAGSSRQCKWRAGGGLWLHTCDSEGMSEIESLVGQFLSASSILLWSPGAPQIRQSRRASSFAIRFTTRSAHGRRQRLPSTRRSWTLVSSHSSLVHGSSMYSHVSCPGRPLKLATSCIRCSSCKIKGPSVPNKTRPQSVPISSSAASTIKIPGTGMMLTHCMRKALVSLMSRSFHWMS